MQPQACLDSDQHSVKLVTSALYTERFNLFSNVNFYLEISMIIGKFSLKHSACIGKPLFSDISS